MLGTNELLQGRYKIIRQLGQGGMGAVYEAEDAKQFGKIVALKEILTSLTNTSDEKQHELFRSAFEREAKILMQVDHEAFPQVIDYFSEIDRQFIVMQLIQGKDLNELLIKHQGAFSLEQVYNWADQLLDALDYLHTLDPPIIHRDIKPQNLKLTSRGKIKLLDFGIAKGMDTKSSVTITNATIVAATLHYSPSEQLLRVIDPITRDALQMIYGEKMEDMLGQNADLRSDIYSLAATLYHFLTNKPPIDSLKRSIEYWRDNPDNLVAPNKVNPQIPQEISDWILKAMEIDRKKRFSSALEMRNSLHKAITGKSQREEEVKQQSWAIEQEKIRIEREKLELERQDIERQRNEHQRRIEQDRQRRAAQGNHNPQDAATFVNTTPENRAGQNPTNPGLTQPAIIPPAESFKDEIPPPPENTPHQSTALPYFDGLKIGEEKPPEHTAAHGATEISYFDEAKFKQENNPTASAPQVVKTEQPPKAVSAAAANFNDNIKWLIPLAALALLFISGIAIGMWFVFGSAPSKSAEKDTPTFGANATNTNASVSTKTEPSPSPEVEAGTINVNETPAQTPDSAPTPAPDKTTVETRNAPPPKPSAPPVQRTPQPASKQPPPVKKTTPKPPPKKKKDMNCIFTDDCR